MDRELGYIQTYYENYDEEGRLLSRHGQVEFITTMSYIRRYAEPAMKILEIGTGTGRYAHTLARAGYEVSAVELVQSNIEVFKANTLPEERISIRQGDALDLSCFADESFDITLLLGPMYHLYTEEDKRRALSEALRVTKKGGLLYTAYCVSDATVICYGFWEGHIIEVVEKGLVDTETFRLTSRPEEIFELCRKEDIDALMAGFDADRLHYVGTDMTTNYNRELIDGMSDEVFALYLKYHLSICERADLVGVTHHSMDIVRKKGV